MYIPVNVTTVSEQFPNQSSSHCPLVGYATVDRTAEFIENTYELAVVVLVVNIFLPIFAIIGNSLVVATVFTFEQLREVPANFLLVNLALSDLIIGSFIQISFAVNLGSGIASSTAYCPSQAFQQSSIFLGSVLIIASVSALGLITFDRFIAIMLPMRYVSIVTTRRVNTVIFMSWLISIGLAVGYRYPTTGSLLGSVPRYCLLAYLTGVYAAILGVHVKLLLVSRRHYKQIQTELQRFHPDAETKQEKVGIKTALMASMVFLLTYIPRTMLSIKLRAFGDGEVGSTHRAIHNGLDNVSATFLLLSCSINPYVFYFRSDRLRRYVWKLVGLNVDRVRGL